jgi:chromosome partitioning protein
VLHQLVHFFERAFVEQQFDALAHRQFALAMLAFTPFGAATFLSRRVAASNFLKAIHELKDNIGTTMDIVAVAGRKGGIGKSTIAGNLAGEFVAMRRRVIVLDADPQHSLAAWAAQGEGMLSKCVRKIEGGSAEILRAEAKKAEKNADIVVIDTPPGMPETAYQAALVADLVLLPCGPSPLDLFALKEALNLSLKARAERRSKKPRIRFVPSRVLMNTNLGRGLSSSLEKMGKKVLPGIAQRIVLAEAVNLGLTIPEYAPSSPAHQEFQVLAKAVEKILRKG